MGETNFFVCLHMGKFCPFNSDQIIRHVRPNKEISFWSGLTSVKKGGRIGRVFSLLVFVIF